MSRNLVGEESETPYQKMIKDGLAEGMVTRKLCVEVLDLVLTSFQTSFFQGIMIKNAPTFCKKGQVPIKPLSLLLCQQGTTSRSFTWMRLTSCCDKLRLFVRLRQQVVQPCCHSTHTLLIEGHEL